MSQREYLRALNSEIQKLNEIIDWKILENVDYRKEARRHKMLLKQLRSDESRHKFSNFLGLLFPLWR